MSNVAFEGGGAREWKTHQMDSVPVRLKIEAFEGSKEQLTSWMTGDRAETAMSNVYAQIQLVNQGRPMGLPTRTGYTMFGAQCVWGEMVSFNHCRLSDLPRTAEIHVTLAALDAPRSHTMLGEASFRLFSKRGRLKRGRKKIPLRLCRGEGGDGVGTADAGAAWDRTADVPADHSGGGGGGDGSQEGSGSLVGAEGKDVAEGASVAGAGSGIGAESMRRTRSSGSGSKGAAVADAGGSRLRRSQSPETVAGGEGGGGGGGGGKQGGTGGFAMDKIEKMIQRYERHAIDHVPWLDKLAFQRIEQLHRGLSDRTVPPTIVVELERWEGVVSHSFKNYNVVPQGVKGLVRDPEIGCDSPIEHKHRKLARSLHRAIVDRNLKPDVQERRQIDLLLQAPWDWADLTGTKMTSEQKELLWRYRFALTKEKKALVKFLTCVDWSDRQEAQQAVDLIGEWEQQVDLDANDALQLLSANFGHLRVRDAAVKCLSRVSDDELNGYLLQLVQSIRYEVAGRDGDCLLNLLIGRALSNFEIANYLHWYIYCQQLIEAADTTPAQGGGPKARPYERAQRKLMNALEKKGDEGKEMVRMLEAQHDLVGFLTKLAQDVKSSREARPRKVERLRQVLASSHKSGPWAMFGHKDQVGVRLNMNPSIMATGFYAEDTEIFKSSMMPLGVSFLSSVPQLDVNEADRIQYKYRIIFKEGDDLRQDQLVMQMIRLMDKELKQTGLDLRLTPYRCFATSPNSGMVERVESMQISKILAEYGKDIQRYLRQHHADSNAPYGIAAEVMDTYIKSLAGYCVVTYLLGVGDRHLDNVLLCPDGRLFHIDFGYILGRDPKPMPPPFKLVREMVDAMGGQQSPHYRRFQQYCSEAYIILRRRGELFINLMMLMKDANIPDLCGSSTRGGEDPERQLYKLWERFHLEMSNEEAYAHMQALISQSQSALVPQVVEWAHKLKQDYWTM